LVRSGCSRRGVREDKVINWLLGEDNPCVRYQTFTQLLGMSQRDSEVAATRDRIQEWGPVRKILNKQNRKGGWDRGSSWYHPKYKSSIWQLLTLSQMGIDPALPQIERMCEYAFRFQRPSGGFVGDLDPEKGAWAHLAGCLNGNVIASLCRLGYSKDRRVRRAAVHLMSFQEGDGGWGCRSFGYHRTDRHSCFMGSICALEGLVELSKGARVSGLEEAIASGCEFFLSHRLFRSDHHEWKVINREWMEPRAPWLVGYNILRALSSLTDAGVVRDERMDEATEILRSKRNTNGRWTRNGSWPSNTYSSFGHHGEEDKWITLRAMIVLHRTSRNR